MKQKNSTPTAKRNRRIRLCMFVSGLSVFAQLYLFQPLLPELCQFFGVEMAASSLAVSLSTIGMAAGLLFFAFTADSIARERLMGMALIASSLLTLATAFAVSFPLLLALSFLKGATLAGVSAVALAYLTEEIDKTVIGAAISLYLSGNTIGGMSGRVAGTLIAGWHGWRGHRHHQSATRRAVLPADTPLNEFPSCAGQLPYEKPTDAPFALATHVSEHVSDSHAHYGHLRERVQLYFLYSQLSGLPSAPSSHCHGVSDVHHRRGRLVRGRKPVGPTCPGKTAARLSAADGRRTADAFPPSPVEHCRRTGRIHFRLFRRPHRGQPHRVGQRFGSQKQRNEPLLAGLLRRVGNRRHADGAGALPL